MISQDEWVKNIQDIKGEVLCVPQFTLHDALEKGKKYEKADEDAVRQIYDYFIEQLREACLPDQVNNSVLETKVDVELLDDTPIRFNYHSADETVKIKINTQMAKKGKLEDGK
ncbi:uncharacterized protein N7484_006165 [Penicillium longicatenatum]|uniref:uncharacterized protein n=1 Tax=Penicillium longicatenatum TaxID=1561947 RepID=UPI002547FA08|nr:uncharacterized protein N7484_006165 [Penicillium longicatenatum]KAJ5643658.1 hypothetical protein N7484_006165 [Penicillium longicatenatum]